MQRLRGVWSSRLGEGIFDKGYQRGGMVGEDYAHFIYGQGIPSVYFMVGGSAGGQVAAARAGQATLAYNHSPLFRADAEKSIQTGVLATTRTRVVIAVPPVIVSSVRISFAFRGSRSNTTSSPFDAWLTETSRSTLRMPSEFVTENRG